MHLHQPIRHLTGPIVAVLIAAGLACPALAQDASPAEPSAGTGSAWPPGLPVGTTVEVVAGGDPQADLWVVSPSFATPTRIGPAIVGRFDGTTGIPVAGYMPDIPGCVFDAVVGPSAEGFWVIDKGIQHPGRPASSMDPTFTLDPASPGAVTGSGREARCLAWVAFDGTPPMVARLPEPVERALNLPAATVVGDELWYVATVSGTEVLSGVIPKHALFRLLPGDEPQEVAPDVVSVQASGDRIWALEVSAVTGSQLLAIDPQTGRSKPVRAAGSPAFLSGGEGHVVTDRYVSMKRGGTQVVAEVWDAPSGRKRATIRLDSPYYGLGEALLSPEVIWSRAAGDDVALFATPIAARSAPRQLVADCLPDSGCYYRLLQADADGLWAVREQYGSTTTGTLEHWSATTLTRDAAVPIFPDSWPRP